MMASQAQEFKAKTVDEAIEEGLAALKVQREAVDIEVVNRGSRGIFGIGSEPAVVRIILRPPSPAPTHEVPAIATPKEVAPVTPERVSKVVPPVVTPPPSPVTPTPPSTPVSAPPLIVDEPEPQVAADEDKPQEQSDEANSDSAMEALAVEMLDRMIYLMGFEATVTASWHDEDEDDFEEDEGPEEVSHTPGARRYLHLDVEGADLGALIGRRGETLENIQYLLRLMVNQKLHRWKNVIIDIEHYKARRVTQLTQLAQRMAEQVARSGRAVSLEPMPANERRIVHMALREHPDVYTESYGDGNRRKVHIFAKG